ncbi:MAG: hypothetical protein QNJ51_25730 [Calothrix sp. MO_167.B12]|nr:hypothetical protein [Calothrix sp. MO_167.B12]
MITRFLVLSSFAFNAVLIPLLSNTPTLAQKKLPVRTTPISNTSKPCIKPKPKPRGCRTIGKPCIIYICKNGKWVAQRVDTNIPRPRPIPTNPSQTGPYGPRGPGGYCPPEYRRCY